MIDIETKLKLINQVTEELKDIITIPEDLQIGDCKATSYLGQCDKKNKKIVISIYVATEQDYKDVLAHELIHFMCDNHRKEFKEYCNKINSLGLGYNVQTTAKNVSNIDEIRKIRKEKIKKNYIVWCSFCGWNRIYKRKCNQLNKYRCPKCHHKSLKQKIYKDGVSIRFSHVL